MTPAGLPCVIHWDPAIFSEGKRSLPTAMTLSTQLYCEDAAWSVVFALKAPAVDQGLVTVADEVRFLVDQAPHELLHVGFRFPFFEGGNVIGECEVIEPEADPLDQIEVLEVTEDSAQIRVHGVEQSVPLGKYVFPGPLREALVEAIVAGTKTTTSSLAVEYRDRALPAPGDYEVVVDSANAPICVTQISEVSQVPLHAVEHQHVVDEGENFATLAQWTAAHKAFWESNEFRQALGSHDLTVGPDTEIVCVRFHVVNHVGNLGGKLKT